MECLERSVLPGQLATRWHRRANSRVAPPIGPPPTNGVPRSSPLRSLGLCSRWPSLFLGGGNVGSNETPTRHGPLELKLPLSHTFHHLRPGSNLLRLSFSARLSPSFSSLLRPSPTLSDLLRTFSDSPSLLRTDPKGDPGTP